jgi:lysophospholipase L1-like esterase
MTFLSLILFLIIGIVFIEAAVAFVYFPLRHGKPFYRLWFKSRIFTFDKDLGFIYRKNMKNNEPTTPLPSAPRRVNYVDFRTNSDGLPCHEEIGTMVGKQIFCIGGSTTAGAESRYDQTYPALLDQKMRRDGYRVINAGISAYRSIHEKLLFNKLKLKYDPWAIIIFSGYNDWQDFTYLGLPLNAKFNHTLEFLPKTSLGNIMHQSAALHLADQVWKHQWWRRKLGMVRLPGGYKDRGYAVYPKFNIDSVDDKAWQDEWKNNIDEIIRIAKERDIKCYLLGYLNPAFNGAAQEVKDFADSTLHMDGRFDTYAHFVDVMEGVIRETAKKNGVPFLDVRRAFEIRYPEYNDPANYKARFELFCDRLHFTEKGNDILSNLVLETLIGEGNAV